MLRCSIFAVDAADQPPDCKEPHTMASLANLQNVHSQGYALDALQALKASFIAWRVERRRRNALARELASYTDRELFDLGIQSADIPAIINGTYVR